MGTMTLEQVREKIKRNFPQQGGSAKQKLMEWQRETTHSVVTTCGSYRLTRRDAPDGTKDCWFLSSCSPPRHLSGPFLMARDARQAAEDHRNGMPLQADLG